MYVQSVVRVKFLGRLPKDRPHLLAFRDRLDRRRKAPPPRRDLPKTLDVRQVAARLDREGEAGRGCLSPAGRRLRCREAVEGRVDLHRVEVLRVVLEPAGSRELAGVEEL